MLKFPGMAGFLFSCVFLLWGAAARAELPGEVWVARDQAEAFDPAHPAASAVKLAKGTRIQEPFLLNAAGKRYQPGAGQKVFAGRTPGEVVVGVVLEGRTLAVPVADLSKTAPRVPVPVIRAAAEPATRPEEIDPCSVTARVEMGVLRYIKGMRAALLLSMPDADLAEKLVHDFHQTDCGTLRRGSTNMETEFQALDAEWAAYRKRRQAESGTLSGRQKKLWDKALEHANQLDLVARTVAFEGHPVGQLDSVPGEACRSASDCPVHRCEQRIIALSIRNRALHPACKGRGFGCSAPGDIIGVATAPKQYNIWMPTMTSPRIAGCQLREPGADIAATKTHLQLRSAVTESARILFRPQKQWKIRAADGEDVTKLAHYFHPLGMSTCDPASFNDRYQIDAAYVSRRNGKGLDYDVAWSQTVVLSKGVSPQGSDAVPFYPMRSFSGAERADRIARGEVNPGYDFPQVVDPWSVQLDKVKKVGGAYSCLPMGLAAYGRSDKACESPGGKQHYMVPHWGFSRSAKQTRFLCDIGESRLATLGGACDFRMQPILGVN